MNSIKDFLNCGVTETSTNNELCALIKESSSIHKGSAGLYLHAFASIEDIAESTRMVSCLVDKIPVKVEATDKQLRYLKPGVVIALSGLCLIEDNFLLLPPHSFRFIGGGKKSRRESFLDMREKRLAMREERLLLREKRLQEKQNYKLKQIANY